MAQAWQWLLVAVTAWGALGGPLIGQVPLGGQAEAEARRATDRIRALQHESELLAAQERTLLVELRQLEVERDLRTAELAKLNAEVAATAAELARTEAEARRLEEDARAQEPDVASRLVELYKLGRARYWRLLLNVDDMRAIGRAYRSVSMLARLDQERLTAHRTTIAALTATRAALLTRQVEMQALQDEAKKARAAIERAVASYMRRIADIDTRRDLNARLTGELQMAQQQLQATLNSLGASSPSAIALPLAPFRGALDWPTDGPIVVPFGRQVRSRYGTIIQRNGVEIGAAEGAAVLAIHDASVAFADPFTGYGNLVVLDHGEQAYSLYGFLATLNVRAGDTVGRGAVLGTAGRPAAGESSRVYFELRIDGKPVDPVEWLRKR